MQLVPFDRDDTGHVAAAAVLWEAACGAELAISERAVRFNCDPMPGALLAGRWALDEYGTPTGLVLASTLRDDPAASPPELGYVDFLAVHPHDQGAGIGSALLAWAEAWLAEAGCTRVRLGGSLRPFAPGVPVELGTEDFFRARGYGSSDDRSYSWDVAADLAGYPAAPGAETADATAHPAGPAAGTGDFTVRPAEPGEEQALLEFFRREFGGRWRREFEDSLREGARISDYLILLTGRGIDGFAHATYEDSNWPLDRVFPARLPQPWGQLGPLGVSWKMQGRGLGRALMEGALRHLKARGVRGCVIDWTTHLEFYARFGFEPYRKYVTLHKRI